MVLPRWSRGALLALIAHSMRTYAGDDIASTNKSKVFEGLHLKKSKDASEFPVQVLSVGNGEQALIQEDGAKFDLSLLQPYADLFSSDYFSPSADKSEVVDKRTGKRITVSIFRASYDDGSTLLVEKDGSDGRIAYAEVRRPRGIPDMFLVPDVELGVNSESSGESFLTFTSDDIDTELLNSKFSYGEVEFPTDIDLFDGDRLLRTKKREKAENKEADKLSNAESRQGGDETFSTATWSTICPSFQVVNIAIVFDSDFCSMFGSFELAQRRIMTIVASASYHYER